ncbi:N-acetylmannosamine-6-phosphate 2-epimerase [Candidatus Sumerlaeota bacterium]|nr:N-acetylmannosamine-6-phosphate 2-epimerase [Candidatus Sumerlaeota bacterium]
MTHSLTPKQTHILQRIYHGLIVSCQARPEEPLFGSEIMARMAKAAELGGAVGIRANSPDDIRAIKQMVSIPVIGIFKKWYPDSPVYITPTIEEALWVAEAGADIVAIDATQRPRPHGERLSDVLEALHKNKDILVMADISTLEEGLNAEKLGFDLVATTLAGYTEYSKQTNDKPALELVEHLAQTLSIPVLAEGRISTPEQAAEALRRGAWAVVVGTAITRPQIITQCFVRALRDVPPKTPPQL